MHVTTKLMVGIGVCYLAAGPCTGAANIVQHPMATTSNIPTKQLQRPATQPTQQAGQGMQAFARTTSKASASTGIRFGAWCINFIIGTITTRMIMALLSYTGKTNGPASAAQGSTSVGFLISLIVNTIDIGKMSLGLEIVDAQGNAIGVGKYILREILKAILTICFLVNFIGLLTKDGRLFHDQILNTRVVYKEK